MFRTLILAIVLLASAAVANGQTTEAARNQELIRRLEAEWNRANELSDPKAKERLLAPDSYHVGPSGAIYDKSGDGERCFFQLFPPGVSGSDKTIAKTRQRFRCAALILSTAFAALFRSGIIRAIDRGKYVRLCHINTDEHSTHATLLHPRIFLCEQL